MIQYLYPFAETTTFAGEYSSSNNRGGFAPSFVLNIKGTLEYHTLINFNFIRVFRHEPHSVRSGILVYF